MPSILHEVLIELLREQPSVIPALLSSTGVCDVPVDATVRIAAADLGSVTPTEYRADLVALLGEPEPLLGAVVESQLEIDLEKIWKWPAYAGNLRDRHRCPVIVVVFTVGRRVADWASRPIRTGGGSTFVPVVFGPGTLPRVTELETARRFPSLALISAIVYGKEPGACELLEPVKLGLELLDTAGDGVYLEVVSRALELGARRMLEEMMQVPKDFQYTFRPLREAFENGLEQGEARGEARGVLRLLEKRRIPVPDCARDRVLACTDLTLLSCWFDRAMTASSIEEVLEG